MSVEVKNVFTFPIFVYSFIHFPVNVSDPFRLTFTLRSLPWIISDNRSHGIMKNTWHLQRTKIWKHSSSTRLKPVHAVQNMANETRLQTKHRRYITIPARVTTTLVPTRRVLTLLCCHSSGRAARPVLPGHPRSFQLPSKTHLS